MVSVARRILGGPFTGYAPLYDRALTIAHARARNVCCSDGGFLHQRILNHGWFKHDAVNLARALVCVGISCWKEDESRPTGEETPTLEELAAPRIIAQTVTPDTLHEIYNDADMRDVANPTDTFLVSYGEYVRAAKGIDYGAVVQRAEDLAKFHLPFLKQEEAAQSHRNGLKIVRREWFCATNPDVAVVHIYIQVPVR